MPGAELGGAFRATVSAVTGGSPSATTGHACWHLGGGRHLPGAVTSPQGPLGAGTFPPGPTTLGDPTTLVEVPGAQLPLPACSVPGWSQGPRWGHGCSRPPLRSRVTASPAGLQRPPGKLGHKQGALRSAPRKVSTAERWPGVRAWAGRGGRASRKRLLAPGHRSFPGAGDMSHGESDTGTPTSNCSCHWGGRLRARPWPDRCSRYVTRSSYRALYLSR